MSSPEREQARPLKMRAIVCLTLFAACGLLAPRAAAEISLTDRASSDWPYYGRALDNQRFSPLAQINADNAGQLKLAWRFNTGKIGSFQTSPIVRAGVMYLTTPYNDVIALRADTGETLWRYRHALRKKTFCCGPANRGPAVTEDKVYAATIDARLIALDRDTGKVVWDIDIADADAGQAEVLTPLLGEAELRGAKQSGQTGYTANLAPQVYGGKILAGISGAGYGLHLDLERDGDYVLSVGGLSGGGHGLRGFIVAYDAETGREVWRWHSAAEENWQGEWREETAYGVRLNRDLAAERLAFQTYSDTWRYGGGSIYTTPAIDPELGLVYIGTGNPSPQMDDSTRPGDNLHTVSLVALDLATGALRWHYQQVPHDRWGYDVASPPVLFELEDEAGNTLKAVGQASKLGWFFIHDRQTGELIRRSEAFVKQENLFARPSPEGARIVPRHPGGRLLVAGRLPSRPGAGLYPRHPPALPVFHAPAGTETGAPLAELHLFQEGRRTGLGFSQRHRCQHGQDRLATKNRATHGGRRLGHRRRFGLQRRRQRPFHRLRCPQRRLPVEPPERLRRQRAAGLLHDRWQTVHRRRRWRQRFVRL